MVQHVGRACMRTCMHVDAAAESGWQPCDWPHLGLSPMISGGTVPYMGGTNLTMSACMAIPTGPQQAHAAIAIRVRCAAARQAVLEYILHCFVLIHTRSFRYILVYSCISVRLSAAQGYIALACRDRARAWRSGGAHRTSAGGSTLHGSTLWGEHGRGPRLAPRLLPGTTEPGENTGRRGPHRTTGLDVCNRTKQLQPQ